MQLVAITESVIARQKKRRRKRAEVLALIDRNIAGIKGELEKDKLKKGERLYSLSESVGQVRLLYKGVDVELTRGKFAYEVRPTECQGVEDAVVEALSYLREQVKSGEFDERLNRSYNRKALKRLHKDGQPADPAKKKTTKAKPAGGTRELGLLAAAG